MASGLFGLPITEDTVRATREFNYTYKRTKKKQRNKYGHTSVYQLKGMFGSISSKMSYVVIANSC